MERRIIEAVSALAGFAAVLCMGSTMAYLTSYDQAENQIAVGRNETKIEEDFPTPAPIPLEENPEYQKTVWVTNQSGGQGGSVDCYVRVSLSYSDEDIGRAVVLRNLDTANWKYNGADGYYYYTKILAKGESTTPLLPDLQLKRQKWIPPAGILLRIFGYRCMKNLYRQGILQIIRLRGTIMPIPSARKGRCMYEEKMETGCCGFIFSGSHQHFRNLCLFFRYTDRDKSHCDR